MNDQPLMPTGSSSPFSSGSSSGAFSFVLLGLLGLGAVVFAILAIVFYGKYTAAVKTTTAANSAAAAAARTQQKQADDLATTKAAESPFRSYVAPDSDGSFVINFPKDWSSWIDSEQSGTQVMLVLNPDFVSRTNGQDDLAATRVSLQQTTSQTFMSQFSGSVQQGMLHQSNTTVSGQAAFNLTGTFSDHRTVREVVVPVRDKVLVFTNENSKFSDEFTEILAQAKVNP